MAGLWLGNIRRRAWGSSRVASNFAQFQTHLEEILAHEIRVLGLFQRLVGRDEFAVHEAHEMRVHSDHAQLRARLDVRRDAERFVFANQRADRGRVDHDLVTGDPPAAG